ncbi:TPA: capsule biosynthesis protein CapA, partial [Escherichia coli]|nr:capsule biosynthesis protein CapA [Escherichia coli]
ENKKFAVFDLGARGTSRDILADLMGIDIPLFMFRERKHKCVNDINSYLVDTFNPFRRGLRVFLPSFYELLLSDALTSTCYGYEKSESAVKPIIFPSEITATSLLTLKSQVYMKEFCKDYVSLFKGKWEYINSQTRDAFVYPLSYLCSNTTDQLLLNQYVADDPLYEDKHFPVIYPPLKKSTTATKPVKKIIPNKEQSKTQPSPVPESVPKEANLKRNTFIYFKRKFYKSEITKIIWDKGREMYVKYLN